MLIKSTSACEWIRVLNWSLESVTFFWQIFGHFGSERHVLLSKIGSSLKSNNKASLAYPIRIPFRTVNPLLTEYWDIEIINWSELTDFPYRNVINFVNV